MKHRKHNTTLAGLFVCLLIIGHYACEQSKPEVDQAFERYKQRMDSIKIKYKSDTLDRLAYLHINWRVRLM